ncbi:ATP-binding protein [Dehalobacter sp. TeCB1]|uniref:sensor histidine kinase n=1 Tax=Dehalobacter sp. TeCB1 TaxID=1843715 RepID=UPI00083A5B21|nr:ATP-binding protein [Dehalobacter sp. TeCB1]OCZ49835.1 two-component sensor histidine kinase [Dehalobacter sp. TeCB1]
MKVKFIKIRKISWKLTAIYALVFSLVLVLLNAGILYGVKYFLVHQAASQVENVSRTTSEMIAGTNGEHMNLSDPELMSQGGTNLDMNIRIADPQGIIVNDSENFDTSQLSIVSQFNAIRIIELGEKHIILENTEVYSGGGIKAYLQVAKSMDKEYSFIKLLFILMAVADFFGVILAVITGFMISKRILKPIDKITKTAQEISASDLRKRIEAGDADDELSRLAVTFNQMLERLKDSFEEQNQFVSDASHELRTPISVIQGYISLIDRWGKEDKAVLQEAINAIKNETANMGDLIEELLFLAGGDIGRLQLHKEKINLNDLAAEIIQESRLIAPEHYLDCKINEQIELDADRRMIKQMLRALVDNSIKFTPKGGEISISAAYISGRIEIAVADTGIGIPKGEINNIFNRFYRVDKARTRELGGSGLGLSIAKWIVDAHNGRITAESTVEKGTTITIQL